MVDARPSRLIIDYPIELPSQVFHEEIRNAQRKYDWETIASRRHFNHTTFRQPRPGRVITNPINNGDRPLQVSVDGTISPLPVYPGGLGSLMRNNNHQYLQGGLSGGVLSSIEGQKYARNMLDRRAAQLRSMENPEAPPTSGDVLSPIEGDRMELFGLLNEIVDDIQSGNYTDLVFGNIRRFASLLIRVSPELDTNEYQQIYTAIESALQTASSEEQSSSIFPRDLANRRNNQKYLLVKRNLESLLGFMEELINGDIGNLPEGSRRQLVKNAIKTWNLAGITTVAPRALRGISTGITTTGAYNIPSQQQERAEARAIAEQRAIIQSPPEEQPEEQPEELPESPPEEQPVSTPEARPKNNKKNINAIMELRDTLVGLYNKTDLQGLRDIAKRLSFFRTNTNFGTLTADGIIKRFNKYYPRFAI